MNDPHPDSWTERFPFIDRYLDESETEYFQDVVADLCHYAKDRLAMTTQDIQHALDIAFNHFIHKKETRKELTLCKPSNKTFE